jgi:SOS-response transcriptional repressor LexA
MESQNIYHKGVSHDGIAIHTGFPNPAIDASLKDLDLNQLLIAHSASSYMMRIEGDSWQHLGIFNGDVAIIDRSLTAFANDIVVWWHEDSFMLSHLSQVPKQAVVWGMVTSTIHQFKEIK